MEKLNQYMVSAIIKYLWVPSQLKTIQAWRRASKSCFHHFPNRNNASFWHFVLENLDFIHPELPCYKYSFTGDLCWWIGKAFNYLGEEKVTHLRLTGCDCCDFQLWKQIRWTKFTHLRQVSNVSKRHHRLFTGGFKMYCPQVNLTFTSTWNNHKMSTPEDFIKNFARKLRHQPEKRILNLPRWIDAFYLVLPGCSQLLLPHYQTYFRLPDFFRLSFESFLDASTLSEWKRFSLEPYLMDFYSLSFPAFLGELVQDRYWRRRLIGILLDDEKKRLIWSQVWLDLYTLFPPMEIMCEPCQGRNQGEEYRVYCIYCYFNHQCSEKTEGDLSKMICELGYQNKESVYEPLWQKWKTSPLLIKRLSLRDRLRTCLIEDPDEKRFEALRQTCFKFDLQLKLLVPEKEVAGLLDDVYRHGLDMKRYKFLLSFGYNFDTIIQSM